MSDSKRKVVISQQVCLACGKTTELGLNWFINAQTKEIQFVHFQCITGVTVVKPVQTELKTFAIAHGDNRPLSAQTTVRILV